MVPIYTSRLLMPVHIKEFNFVSTTLFGVLSNEFIFVEKTTFIHIASKTKVYKFSLDPTMREGSH